MKLRSTIVLTLSDNFTYAMDIGVSDSKVFKFESVASFFIRELHKQKDKDQIIQGCLKEFSDCTEVQVREDFEKFLKSAGEFGLLQE